MKISTHRGNGTAGMAIYRVRNCPPELSCCKVTHSLVIDTDLRPPRCNVTHSLVMNTDCKFIYVSRITLIIQGGAQPTDIFEMVIDNIWKQGKNCETVYKYVQVCYLLPTDYKFIFRKLHQADGLRLHQCIVASVSGSCRTRASVGHQ